MVHDPALFVAAIIAVVYAAFALVCWALNIRGTRVAPVLITALANAGAAAFFLLYGVRW